MGVHCQILLRKSKDGVHRAGNPVNGIIKYAIDKPTKYYNVILSLIGSGKCEWNETVDDTLSTYTGKEGYIFQRMSLLNEPGKSVTIPRGTYEYPFQFNLPENIPPSIKNKICTISYHLKVKFVKTSLFSIDRVFRTELTVYSYMNPAFLQGPVIFGLEKSVFKLFSENPKFKLKAEIEKTLLTPGENAKLSLVITNDTDITDWSVKTTLQSHTVYTSSNGRTKTESKNYKESASELKGLPTKVTSMSRVIHILPEMYSVHNSKIMARNYNVIVTLKLPAPHTNSHVTMPVIVGEMRGDEVTINDPLEEPPSYFESV